MPPRGSTIVERMAQLRATQEFISSAPERVQFVRTEVIRDTEDRGGLAETRTRTLDPQTVRVAWSPPRRRRLENSPPDPTFGELSYQKDILVGMPDLDVKQNDRFILPSDGVEYEVNFVFEFRVYETICNIGTFGGNFEGAT
jgi:hypothetical protein